MAEGNDLFIGLVASLQASAWMLLGKVMHPMTGKVERHLEQAKETIDLLGVIEEKTRGNLSPDETRILTQVLYELRLNYVEELKSPQATQVPESPASEATPEPPPGAGSQPAGGPQSSAETPPGA